MRDHSQLIAEYRSNPSRDELTAAVYVARVLEPSVAAPAVDAQLTALHEAFVGARGERGGVVDLIDFMREQGFAGSADMQSMDCSRIDRVLAGRRGIPISLAVVYVMLARRLGLTAAGINFPGHFLVRADDVLIDPMDAVSISREECLRRLADANLEHLGEAAFAPASADEVAVRMLNNIKAVQLTRGDFVGVLDSIDYQLPLVADEGPYQLERADLWFRLGDAGAAVSVLEAARGRLRGTPWHAEIDSRLKRLVGRTRTTLH